MMERLKLGQVDVRGYNSSIAVPSMQSIGLSYAESSYPTLDEAFGCCPTMYVTMVSDMDSSYDTIQAASTLRFDYTTDSGTTWRLNGTIYSLEPIFDSSQYRLVFEATSIAIYNP